ncbi:MAG: T9SS type A sorting domain-containing protein, partial [Aliifodinibius sp.]|nr:T9SS type A sorting domain-containing protein [Fodinibius sp.]NIY28876.1 T9SS type A sorting domain-containing protein [Fodinibius sp.]
MDGDRVFLGTIGGGVFFSTNAGEEWTQLTPAPPSLSIKTLALNSSNPEKLLAAFRWLPGLYSFDFSTAINEGTQEYSEMDSYRLLPNYPNPFNAQTVIEYVLPVSGHITLKIYDITGRQVKVLVNGFKNAGAHTVTWNGTDDLGTVVSSGLYILRLLSEDMDISRKV